MRSLYLLIVYVAILGIGIGAPFIFTLGYIWVDVFRPGNVSYSLLRSLPVALVMGGAAVFSYILLDRRSPPRLTGIMVVTALFSVWVSLTTLWAVVPEAAWAKWDWAFKSVAFSVFIPYAIRSRNHIEAFVQVFVFSLAANMIPFGLKSMVFGGGYGRPLGLLNRNFFLGQGETLATACCMAIPLVLFLMTHSRIVPLTRFTRFGYIGLLVLALGTAIGTHERTALVGLFVVAAVEWMKSKRKVLFTGLCFCVAVVIAISAPPEWYARMSTLSNPTEDPSATVRLQVWSWTLRYVAQHPQGGGFDAYRINQITIPVKPENAGGQIGVMKIQTGRAYHSSYFEVLGEHGWVGLTLFLTIVMLSFYSLRRTVRACRGHPHLAWAGDFAKATQTSLATVLACAAFIGIAFQPFLYYLFALTVCISEYVWRVQSEEVRRPLPLGVPVPAWRAQGL